MKKEIENLMEITKYDLPNLRTEDGPYEATLGLLQIRHRNMDASLSLWSTTRILPT